MEIDEIGEYLSACQVGITMASIGIGALGEPAIAHLLEPVFKGFLGHAVSVAIAVTIAYLLITTAQSIVGEIVPKLYTIQHAEGLARRIARPLRFFRVLFHPFIVVLNGASYSILRMIGTDPTGMAPVDRLVRIGTGRDAKDVAFATIFGQVQMTRKDVMVLEHDPRRRELVEA